MRSQVLTARKWVLCWCVLLGVGTIVVQAGLAPTEEFVGPLPGWTNLKTDFGAVGDGKADDTAAFQRGLDALPLHGQGKAEAQRVLYLPAGTYRITTTLLFTNHSGIAVLGEHPERTRVVYDGPTGGAMLFCNGVSYSKFGRITWDGKGKAKVAVAHQWDMKAGTAVTYMEHADEVFENAGKGIIGGRPHNMDAETLVKRCQFIKCDIGLSIESFNALDWWVWDSQFIDCGVGASNCAKDEYGGGHFHIYRSLFRGSKVADIRIGHASYFGVRLNTSIGSRRFIETIRPAGYGEKSLGRWTDEDKYGAQMSVLHNRILNPQDPTPIWLNNHGPLVLIDNTFVVKKAGDQPVVQVKPPTDGAQCVSIGNRFYGAAGIAVNGSLFEQDNETLDIGKADLTEPVLSPTAPNAQRRVFALTSKSTTAEIQQAIDEAAKLRGQKPVVHLAAGRYSVDQTLRIPANADLQMVGDSWETTLIWDGAAGGTMLRVEGPTRVTLRDFSIAGIWNKSGVKLGRGIEFTNVDQPGGLIWLDQANASDCVHQGLVFDGLARTRVEGIACGAGGTTEGAGLVVNGNGDPKATVTVGIFGSAGGNSKQTHLVRRGGNLVVWDTWYETSVNTPEAEPRYIQLTDRGSLTFFGGHIATLPGEKARRDLPCIELDGFRGNFALIGTQFDAHNPQVLLTGDGKDLAFLALGVNFDVIEPHLDVQAKDAFVVTLACRQNVPNAPPKTLTDTAKVDPVRLRQLLASAREVLPTDWQPAPEGATDLRIHRVMVRYKVGEGMIFSAGKTEGTKQ